MYYIYLNIQYIFPSQNTFEDDDFPFSFSKVGYVSSLEGKYVQKWSLPWTRVCMKWWAFDSI